MNDAEAAIEIENYKNKYFSIFIKILIMNSDVSKDLLKIRQGRSRTNYDTLDDLEKLNFIKDNVFVYQYPKYRRLAKKY